MSRKILVNVIANDKIGLGHVYNMLTILSLFKDDDILVAMKAESSMGIDRFKNESYKTKVYKDKYELLHTIREFSPDMMFNDILDTNVMLVKKFQTMGCFVVNFEDIGPGSDHADLVFNPIYFQRSTATKFFGEKYACVREEFRMPATESERRSVVVTFGGVDTRRLTLRILRILERHRPEYEILVIIGEKFAHQEEVLNQITKMQNAGITIEGVIKADKIAEYIDKSMFAITANGRTVFEVASRNIPVVTISANSREEKHEFSKRKKIGYHIGMHSKISDDKILKTIKKIELKENREKFEARLEKMNLRESVYGVREKINRAFERWKEKQPSD